jgi:hypothetical protein
MPLTLPVEVAKSSLGSTESLRVFFTALCPHSRRPRTTEELSVELNRLFPDDDGERGEREEGAGAVDPHFNIGITLNVSVRSAVLLNSCVFLPTASCCPHCRTLCPSPSIALPPIRSHRASPPSPLPQSSAAVAASSHLTTTATTTADIAHSFHPHCRSLVHLSRAALISLPLPLPLLTLLTHFTPTVAAWCI